MVSEQLAFISRGAREKDTGDGGVRPADFEAALAEVSGRDAVRGG